MSNCQRIGIFGRSKSGKSTLMDRLVSKRLRLIMFDHIDEREASAQAYGLVKVDNLYELQERVDKHYLDGFRYWFQPDGDDLVQCLSDTSKWLLDIQKQFAKQHGASNRPEITLAVDEMANCFPNHTLRKDQDQFSLMCREGRHKGIHLIGATQRPAEVSTKFRGQLEKRFFFSLQDPADLGAVKNMGGVDGDRLAEIVRMLKKLQYVRMENGEYQYGELTFPDPDL